MTKQLTHAAFSEHVHTKFRLEDLSGSTMDVVLEEVSNLKSSARQEQFSIYFRGPSDNMLQQGTYRVDHSNIGSFDLFLVPVGRNEQGYSYEVVFNRLLEAEENRGRSSRL